MTAGRPTTYTPELGSWVCQLISTSEKGLDGLSKLHEKFPHPSTIYLWTITHKEFSEKYFEAKAFQANVLAESTLDNIEKIQRYEDKDGVERIDPGILGAAKLDFQTKVWHASKLQPKRWGDAKQLEEVSKENDGLKQQLLELRSQLAEQNKKEY